MFLLQQILPGAVAALLVAIGIGGLAWLCKSELVRATAAPFAAGIAYATGHLVVAGWASFPPSDTTNWLPYLALAAAIIGALYVAIRANALARAAIFAPVVLVAFRLLLRPKFQYGWSPAEGWTYIAALTVGIILLMLILDRLIRQSATIWEIPGLLLIVCGGIFGALMLSGSVLLGQFATVLMACTFGSVVLVVRNISLIRGFTPVLSFLIGALLVSGYCFAALPATSASLLGGALLMALLPINFSKRLLTTAVRTALVSIPVAIALVMAFTSSPPMDY